MLDRVSLRDCPRCGCNDNRVVGTSRGWSGPRLSLECGNCGEAFDAAEPAKGDHPAVQPKPEKPKPPVYVRPTCPECGGRDVPIVRTMPESTKKQYRIRYHKCRGCGHSFHSAEPK